MQSKKKPATYEVSETQLLIVQRMADMQACVHALTEAHALLRRAVSDCWHAANTYDGNYARACDGVMTIAANALKATDPVAPVKPADAQVQEMLKVFGNLQFKTP